MKRILIVLILLALNIVLAQSDAPENYNKMNTEVSGTVRLGTFEGGETIAALEKAIAEFNKTYPNVQVKIEAVPTDYETKLINQFAAGDAPDIFQLGDGAVRPFVDRNVVENLTPYVNGEYGFDTSIFFPNLLPVGEVNDQLYFLPKGWSGTAIYYNKDMFACGRHRGLPLPTGPGTTSSRLPSS